MNDNDDDDDDDDDDTILNIIIKNSMTLEV